MVYTIRVQYMSERTVQYIINNNKTLCRGSKYVHGNGREIGLNMYACSEEEFRTQPIAGLRVGHVLSPPQRVGLDSNSNGLTASVQFNGNMFNRLQFDEDPFFS